MTTTTRLLIEAIIRCLVHHLYDLPLPLHTQLQVASTPNALDPTAVGTIQQTVAAIVSAPPKIPATAVTVLPIKDTLTPFRVMTKSDSNADSSEASVVVCTTTLQFTLLKDNGVPRTYLAVGHDTGEIYLKEIVDGARLVGSSLLSSR